MGSPVSFARNAEIYAERAPADYLYRVLSGTVRTYRALIDGRRQVGAFYLPGDMFGLEGGESFIPLLNTVIEDGAALGVEEFVTGMAHRGRLNTLANVMGKPYEMILGEFEGPVPTDDDERARLDAFI